MISSAHATSDSVAEPSAEDDSNEDDSTDDGPRFGGCRICFVPDLEFEIARGLQHLEDLSQCLHGTLIRHTVNLCPADESGSGDASGSQGNSNNGGDSSSAGSSAPKSSPNSQDDSSSGDGEDNGDSSLGDAALIQHRKPAFRCSFNIRFPNTYGTKNSCSRWHKCETKPMINFSDLL